MVQMYGRKVEFIKQVRGFMQNNRKKIAWIVGTVVGFLAIMFLVIGLLTLINGTPGAEQTPAAPSTTDEQSTDMPATINEAEALKTEAMAAMNDQKFDLAVEKYTAAKGIYEASNDEMHASDLQMQIDTALAQKKEVEKIKQQNANNPLRPTNQ